MLKSCSSSTRTGLVYLGAILFAFALSAPAVAQTVGDFYRGKQIRMIVGTAAGQDYDIWARLLTRYLGQHIPGNPTFITENMPGAAHIIATNYLFNQAAQDGTVIGMVTHSIVDDAILNVPNVRFDPLQFKWIGSPQFDHRGLFVSTRSNITQAEDLFEHELVVGVTAAQQSVTTVPILLKNILGMKLKIISGYRAPAEIALAMERGEVGGLVEAIGGPKGQRRHEWLESDRMRVLFTMETDPVGWLGAPTIFNFTKTEEQRSIFRYLASNTQLWRPVLAPPGVPSDRVVALQRAFDATISDPAFLAEASDLGLEVSPWNGKEVEARVKSAMATPKDIPARIAAALEE